MKRITIALLLAVLLVACGGRYEDIDALAAGAECQVEKQDTDTWFTTMEYYCEDGRVLSWFDTSEARDNYRDIATQFGAVTLDEGSNYLIMEMQ